MGTSKNQNKKTTDGNDKNFDQTVEVLYQKMGDRWFAFSLIDDEVFVGSIAQDDIDAAQAKARQPRTVHA